MKKTLLFCVCLMALLCSCSKDDGAESNQITPSSIYGSWNCVSEQHARVETEEIYETSKHQLNLVFFEDGSCVYYTGAKGKYQIAGNQLVISYGSSTATYTIKQLTNSRLVIQRIEGGGGKDWIAIYTYEKA